jgi:CDP-diglyceride synthetase
MGIAGTKVLAVMGVDWPILLPAGMALNDVFAALIGIAIIKERLFDITLVLKKGALYSVIGAGVIFIFSFSEHMLATYVGEFLGESSMLIHLISIAVVIAVLMPAKQCLEKYLENYFKTKQYEF